MKKNYEILFGNKFNIPFSLVKTDSKPIKNILSTDDMKTYTQPMRESYLSIKLFVSNRYKKFKSKHFYKRAVPNFDKFFVTFFYIKSKYFCCTRSKDRISSTSINKCFELNPFLALKLYRNKRKIPTFEFEIRKFHSNVTNSSFLGIYERETSLPGYFFLADWNASTSLPLTATNLLSTTAMYFPEYFFDNSCECLNKKSSCILSTYCNYKSGYLNVISLQDYDTKLLQLQVNYTDDSEGKTIYLFSNTTENKHGLLSMQKPWIVLMNYQTNDQPLFITTSRKTLSSIPLKITATEDEKITKLTFNQSFSSNTNLTLAYGYLGTVNTRSDTG